MKAPLDWQIHSRHWPHREASRFVEVGGLRWHVQQMGSGPPILLLHGTGASTHSWRGVMPVLAESFTVTAPDLPGHAFTAGGGASTRSLAGMARAFEALLAELAVEPALFVGHSAGAAIALQMVLDGHEDVPVVGFNAALTPFSGVGETLFPAMAKLLFVNPFAPRIFAGMARLPGEAGRFLYRSTGSRIDDAGLRCYAALLGNSRHCKGALAMMAHWDLRGFKRRLGEIEAPALLVHSDGDKAVPLSSAREAAALIPSCTLEVLPGLGHLAHEEQPETAVGLVADFAAKHAMPLAD